MQEVRGSIPLSSTTMTVDQRDGLAIDIQINHGWVDFAEHVKLARQAERAGFGTLWVADHLSGRSMNAPSMPECFTTLGGLAAATTRIGLGSLVANAQLRHPAVLANAAATVQQMSGGRFVLGIGAGASPTSRFADELHRVGIPIPPALADRHSSMLETVQTVRRIWGDKAEDRFPGFPVPQPAPKVIIGVNSVELARLAISCADGVNVRSSHPQLAEIVAVARGKCEVSLWTEFAPDLLDPRDARRRQWREMGVERLVLLITGKPDEAVLREAVL